METKKIKFVSNKPGLTQESLSVPKPIRSTIPQWYRDADRFLKMPNGEYWEARNIPGLHQGGKIPGWKACPAIFDIMSAGYSYVLPCDIEFYISNSGLISVKVHDKAFDNFVVTRDAMPQFHNPEGYYSRHFAFMPEWAVETPEGYSVLYSHPFNRFELPFLMTNGIIDNDKVNLPGSMPFFIKEGFEGVIPAGTPYAQIFPFKRENWESEVRIEADVILAQKYQKDAMRFRKPDGGVYQREVWERRKYE